MNLLVTAHPGTSLLDKIVWDKDTSATYTVRSFVSSYMDSKYSPSALLKLCWSSICLPKIKFCNWIVLHSRLPTCDFLTYISGRPLDSPSCPFCIELESQNHVLLHCTLARSVWNDLFRWLNVSMVMPFSTHDFFSLWSSLGTGTHQRSFLNSLWMILVWEIWKWKNRRIFSNQDHSRDIFYSSLYLAAYLLHCRFPAFPFSVHTIICTPSSFFTL